MSDSHPNPDEYNLYAQDFEKAKAFEETVKALEASNTKQEFMKILNQFEDNFMDRIDTPGI